MKPFSMFGMIHALAALLMMVAAANAQELVFSNQTITVQPSQLSIEAVRYTPESIVTNTTTEWVDQTAYYTNFFHNPPIVATNESAQVQVAIETVTTNAAHWTAEVKFELPRGYRWELNGIPVEIDRFSTRLQVELDPAAVQSVFGASYPALLFAAQTGNYQPAGQVRDGFLSIAAQALAAGGDL